MMGLEPEDKRTVLNLAVTLLGSVGVIMILLGVVQLAT